MKTYKTIFNGTEEQMLLGATFNDYTGFRPLDSSILLIPGEMPQPEQETLDEFMCRILKIRSPKEFIEIAVRGIEKKAGTDNYNAEEMMQAMLNLLTIEEM
jgi:hypothetical protein